MKLYFYIALFVGGLFSGAYGMHIKNEADEKKRLEAEAAATRDLDSRQFDRETENAEQAREIETESRVVTREVIRYQPVAVMADDWVRIHNCATGADASACQPDDSAPATRDAPTGG